MHCCERELSWFPGIVARHFQIIRLFVTSGAPPQHFASAAYVLEALSLSALEKASVGLFDQFELNMLNMCCQRQLRSETPKRWSTVIKSVIKRPVDCFWKELDWNALLFVKAATFLYPGDVMMSVSQMAQQELQAVKSSSFPPSDQWGQGRDVLKTQFDSL